MKIKSVLAGAAAVAAMSCASVCAFAEEDNTELLLAAVPNEKTPTEGEATEAKSNPGTGVEGVAAVFGTIVLVGAAVVISRKKA